MTRQNRTEAISVPGTILAQPIRPGLDASPQQDHLHRELRTAEDRLHLLYTQRFLAHMCQHHIVRQKQIDDLILLKQSFISHLKCQLTAPKPKITAAARAQKAIAANVHYLR